MICLQGSQVSLSVTVTHFSLKSHTPATYRIYHAEKNAQRKESLAMCIQSILQLSSVLYNSHSCLSSKLKSPVFVWCCGSEEKEVHPFGGARSTARRRKWRRRREGRGVGKRGGGGARERRGACRGDILTRTQINAPSDIKIHLGGS